jgi:hypothetical protein
MSPKLKAPLPWNLSRTNQAGMLQPDHYRNKNRLARKR